ncbi:MAG: hypothetical protein EB023_08095, partial [Flavobacteriia bacterium]|nr:hypothetical protein [Flavobacteriia bacterium]
MSTESKERIKTLIENSQYLCLFIVLVGMFIGTMYAFNASFFISIPLSFGLIFLVNYVLNILITLRKERRPSQVTFNLGSNVWWGAYVVIAIPISFYTVHMFNVEFGELKHTREIGQDKITFITKWQSKVNESIENGFDSKVLATYTDYLNYKSNLLSAQQVANRNGLTENRIINIHGASPSEIKGNISDAFKKTKDSLVNATSQCFSHFDTSAADKLGKHNFEQFNVIKELDSTILSMKELRRFQNTVQGVYIEVPSEIDFQKQVEAVSLINRPLALFEKHVFSGLCYT